MAVNKINKATSEDVDSLIQEAASKQTVGPERPNLQQLMERRRLQMRPKKMSITLNDTNAIKRTYYFRIDVEEAFGEAAERLNIDKGALLNTILYRWLEEHKNDTEISPI